MKRRWVFYFSSSMEVLGSIESESLKEAQEQAAKLWGIGWKRAPLEHVPPMDAYQAAWLDRERERKS